MLRNRKIFTLVCAIIILLDTTTYAHSKSELFYSHIDQPNSVDIFFAGDLMLHGAQFKSAYRPSSKTYDFRSWFHHMAEPIASADYALLNFETTITDNPSAYSGYPLFRSPHHILYDLKAIGFDGVMTANNHSLDGGLKGLLTTVAHLEKAGLGYTGTAPMGQSVKPLLVERKGFKIAFVNATYGTNGMPIPKDHPRGINLISEETLVEQMDLAKALNPDAIVAYVHWGTEYARQPNSYQKQWAKRIAELGASAIIGAHPHTIQPEEWLTTTDGRQVYVNYSLGNFVSNQRWRYSDTGLAITLRFSKDGVTPIKVVHHPFWVDKETASGAIDYTVIPFFNQQILKRLSEKDKRLIKEATSDFFELYPNKKKALP